MVLISDRPLFIRDQLYSAGVPFEVDREYAATLLERGIARPGAMPRIFYEKGTLEQDAARLREQGGVSCICITKNRRDWLPQAIDSYIAQSYTPRELLIIADGEEVQDLVPDRQDIRLIHIEDGRSIGDKRNYALSLAHGQYVAHWDDDDYSAPDRLMDQVGRLKASGLSVTGYSQIDFTDGTAWWRYTGDRDHAPGSSLLYELKWAKAHRFPFIQVGEDGEFVKEARTLNQIVTAPANGMLRATIHPKNTSPRLVEERYWTDLDRSPQGLSIVVLSKNASNYGPCAEAVRRHEPSARLILVDDGIEGAADADIRIQGEKPFIFARNVNIGIRAAGRDDVVLLNDDAMLETTGGFSLLQHSAARDGAFGIIGSTTNAVGNRNQLPQRTGTLRQDPRMVCFVAVLIPRTTLDKIGYLDERFTAYGFEDDDFCYRVRRAGLKIGVHDGCFVDHASLTSTFRGHAMAGGSLDGGRRIFADKWGSYPL